MCLVMYSALFEAFDAPRCPLDPSDKSMVTEAAPPTNGCEAAIEAFLASVEMGDPSAADHLCEYKQRLVRTLSQLALGSAHRRCAGTWFIPSNAARVLARSRVPACSQGRRSIRADHSEYFQVRPAKPSTQDYERMGGTGRKTQSSSVLAISGEGQLRFTPCP